MTTTASPMTLELLDEIYDTLDTARDTNTLVVRESVTFRQYTKELVKRLQATSEFVVGYKNHYDRIEADTDFITANIISMWHTLHRIGQGENSLSMKVQADKLATAIKESQIWQDYKYEQWADSVV